MKKVFLSFAFIALIFTGCKKEPNEISGYDQVVIFFVPQASLLKSEATGSEKSIQKITLFGVDGQNIIEKYPVINTPSLDGEPLTISRRVTSIYAIANIDVNVATLSTVSDLTNLTNNFTSAPVTPFLMSGIATNLNRSTKIVSIDLVRAVAKVEIIGNEFVIETVTVKNTPSQGYVFGRRQRYGHRRCAGRVVCNYYRIR